MANPLRNLPTLSDILESSVVKSLLNKLSRGEIVSTSLNVLDELRNRAQIAATERTLPTVTELADVIVQKITMGDPSWIGAVINATGELFPETLGTFPLVQEAVRAISELAGDYCGMGNPLSVWSPRRQELSIEKNLQRLTGAESSLVLNSTSGGLLLVFSELARDTRLVVSRGHLYESRRRKYRLPDLLDASRMERTEVGTTNRTLITDFQRALENTDVPTAVFYAYPGHYKVVGSAEMPPLEDLLKLTRPAKIPVIVEMGLGGVMDIDAMIGNHIPCAKQLIAAGADVVLMTGDYLLNGPHCGILLGKHDVIQRFRDNPFCPPMVANAMIQTGLEATLLKYMDSQNIQMALPIQQLLQASVENLRYRAQRIARRLETLTSVGTVTVRTVESRLFGGHPDTPGLETVQLCIHPSVPSGSSARSELAKLTHCLTNCHPAVWGQVESGTLVLDLRTVFPRQDALLVEAFENMRGVEMLDT
ncbi:MAG: hypothetical protein Q4D98_08925 [Planctomycetia bacterium]|nr:hypothetical protein [Planctomycetia bacterium]